MKKHFYSIILLIISVILTCQAQHTSDQIANQMMKEKLIQAVQQNDTITVAKALNNGADINSTDNEGRSLLLIATNKRLTDMALFLLAKGADVNLQAHNKDSAFLYAGASGQTKLLEAFLKHGVRFDIFNRYHGTALIPACERGHVDTVRLLAHTKNFPINHINRLGWTALMEAVILGDGSTKYQQIVQILKDAGADMHIPDHNGITPLQHADKRGYTKIAAIIKS